MGVSAIFQTSHACTPFLCLWFALEYYFYIPSWVASNMTGCEEDVTVVVLGTAIAEISF